MQVTEKLPSKKTAILWVGSEPEVVGRHLRADDPGYLLAEARGMVQALAEAKRMSPDVIICEAVLPDGKAEAFCRGIREDAGLSTVFFILVSKSAEASCYRPPTGVDDLWHPELGSAQLRSKIRNGVRMKRTRDELHLSKAKLRKAIFHIREQRKTAENLGKAAAREKEMLHNSLKQITMMVEERDGLRKAVADLTDVGKETIGGIVELLTTLVEAKPQYHRGHATGVARIAVFMARELNLPKPKVRQIEIAALLHEVGKLTIPDALSLKPPSECTPEELDFLVQHPVKGAALVASFSGLSAVAEIIRHLHEWVEGKGDPDGLKRDAIPVGSRIIAVASRYENLAYRSGRKTLAQIFEAIEAQVGTCYDPKMVNCLHKYASANPLDGALSAREVGVYELKPGDRLASGIFTAGGAKLLPIGTVLTDASLKKLAQYNRIDPLKETVFIKETE